MNSKKHESKSKMSSNIETESTPLPVHSKTSHEPNKEFSKTADSMTLNVARYTGSRVGLSVKVFPWHRDCFKGLIRELGCGECELLEALIEGLHDGLRGRAESVRICKDTFVFVELNLYRVVKRARRRLVEKPRPGDVVVVDHGSRLKCWRCERKAAYCLHEWTTSEKAHRLYLCGVHFNVEKARLQRQNLKWSYKPLQSNKISPKKPRKL